MRRSIGRRGVRAVLLVLLVGGVGAGIAYASMPEPNFDSATIHACVNKSNGNVRLIDPALGSRWRLGACAAKEQAVTWNVEGRPGSQGLPGEKGDKGDKGDTGEQGAAGAAGAKGDKGDTGDQGPAGTEGPKGDTGERGPQGPQGDPGPEGPKGDTGPAGGLKGVHVVKSDLIMAPTGTSSGYAVCPSGETVLGGGFHAPGTLDVTASIPIADEWAVIVSNSGSPDGYYVYAVCAPAS